MSRQLAPGEIEYGGLYFSEESAEATRLELLTAYPRGWTLWPIVQEHWHMETCPVWCKYTHQFYGVREVLKEETND